MVVKEQVATDEGRQPMGGGLHLGALEMVEGWASEDESVRARFSFPVTAASGAASTSIVYFEIEPGHRLSPHTHSAEEVLLILEGTAMAIVDGEPMTLGRGGVAVIPAMVMHNVENAGADTVKAVGFFSAAGMVSTYEHMIMPMATRVLVTPFPDA